MSEEENIIAPPISGETESPDDIEIVDEEDNLDGDSDESSYEVDGEEVKAIEAEAPDDNQDEPEPEPDAESELEADDEVAEESKSKKTKKKHTSLKTEFNKVQRDKFRALNELEEIKKENARLQQLATQSADAATSHFDNSIALKIQQAKAKKTHAYDNADTEALIEADEALAIAYNQKADNERWKSEQEYKRSQQAQAPQPAQQQYEQPEPEHIEMNETTEDWLLSNTWFDPQNGDFDQSMAEDVQEFSEVLERSYARQGRADKVFSPDYFKKIDRYISDNYGADGTPQPPQKRTNLNMKQVRKTAAPAGQSQTTASSGSKNKVVLSAKEKDFAQQMGISNEAYAKEKLKINKSNRYSYENFQR